MWASWKEKKWGVNDTVLRGRECCWPSFHCGCREVNREAAWHYSAEAEGKTGCIKRRTRSLQGCQAQGPGGSGGYSIRHSGLSGFRKTDEAEEDDLRSTHRLRNRPPVAASLSTYAEGGEGKNETQRMKGRRRRMGERVTTRREAGSYQDKIRKERKMKKQSSKWTLEGGQEVFVFLSAQEVKRCAILLKKCIICSILPQLHWLEVN